MAQTHKSLMGQLRPVSAGAPAPRGSYPALVAIGNFLYTLGFSTEYLLVRVGRVLRDVGILAGQTLGILGRGLFRWLQGAAVGLLEDITAPFRHFSRRSKQLARAQRIRKQGNTKAEHDKVFARARVGTLLGLAANIIGGFILPLAAVAVLVFTVGSIVNMQYALAVETNGKVLGYVTDQSVVEGAKSLLRDRIRLAENQEVTDWQLTPTYSIARATGFTTTNQLANQILLSGGAGAGDIVPATGFYMDDRLVAVTTDGDRLKAYLDNILAEQAKIAPEGATVGFVSALECEPDNEDIFFAASVQPFNELMATLSGMVSDEVHLTADGEMDLSALAVEHGLAFETLLARNPQLGDVDGAYVPEEGADLLIQRAKPFLQVQSTIRKSSVEPIPFYTEEVENPDRPKGVRQTMQRGAEGLQEVWDDEIWVDGELERRDRLNEMTVIVEPAQNEIIEIGTKEPRDYLGDLSAPGFIFPVPGTTYSTRGYSPGGHRGLDINAPAGMPIYACEAGVVVNAGWHYSFGNYVEIAHANGINTLYAHCSALYVSAGQQVAKGTQIGAVGSTGNSSGNHCHLEVTVNGQLTDPVGFVGYPY